MRRIGFDLSLMKERIRFELIDLVRSIGYSDFVWVNLF